MESERKPSERLAPAPRYGTASHGIITRFGIGVFDETWFEHRFLLFQSLVLPSIRNQTRRDFVWLICIGVDTLASVEERLHELVRDIDNAVLLKMSGFEHRKCVNYLRDISPPEKSTHIITTRLDDDDALQFDFVKKVSEFYDSIAPAAGGDEGTVLTFTSGYLLNLVDGTIRRQVRDNVTAGLTLIAPRKFDGSIHSRTHSKIHEYAKARGFGYVRLETDNPMWIYTRHRHTESGLVKGLGVSAAHSLLDEEWNRLHVEFGIDVDACRRYFREQEKFPVFSFRKMMPAQAKLRKKIRALENRTSLSKSQLAELARLEKAYREAGSDLFALPDPASLLAHVFVTRFGFGPSSDDLLEFELDLLESLPLASLDNQTNKEFLWVLCVNEDLPQFAMDALERLRQARPHLVILRMAEFSPAGFLAAVHGNARIQGRYYLCSTLLDYGDGLSRTFVESVKNSILRSMHENGYQQGYVLWVPKGYVYSSRRRRAVRVGEGLAVASGTTVAAAPYGKTTCFSVPPRKSAQFADQRGFKAIPLDEERWLVTLCRHRDRINGIDAALAKADWASQDELHRFGFDINAEAYRELGRSRRAAEPWWWKLSRLRAAAKKVIGPLAPTP